MVRRKPAGQDLVPKPPASPIAETAPASNIQSLIQTRAVIEIDIQEARQTIELLEQATWGVTLVEVNGRRYAILPESTPDNPLLTMDGRPTVRLSSE